MSRARGHPIYSSALPDHEIKSGTVTMGGAIILALTILFSTLYFNLNVSTIILNLTLLLFGLLGFVDDILKLKYYNNRKALSIKMKLLFQVICATIIVFFIGQNQELGIVKITNSFDIDLGLSYYFLAIFIIVGSSNAFNFTDGLDGLAIFPFILNITFFFIVSMFYCLQSNIDSRPLMIFYSVLTGSSLAFLWFNSSRATIFMGDTGSLALGAILGVSSIMLHCEVPFIFAALIFIVEALSVILQIAFFKTTGGRRLFLIAPIHHHFERMGINEVKVVIRFWICSILSFVVALYMFFSINTT